MNKLAPKNNPAERWMLEGIKQHESFRRNFQAAKEAALNAGLFFLHASESVERGNLGEFFESYADKISKTTVYRYMEFTTEVFAWVKAEHPKLATEDKILEQARKMVLRSPKGYVALCRQLEVMRKFGEYDEVKYRTRKLGTKQMEFEFADLATSIDHLAHLGDANYNFKFPEGQDEAKFIDEVETKLETALKRVRALKHKSAVTEV